MRTVSELTGNRHLYEMQAVPYLKEFCYSCWAQKQGQSGCYYNDASIYALCNAEHLNVTIHQRLDQTTFLQTTIQCSQTSSEMFHFLLSGYGESAHYMLLVPELNRTPLIITPLAPEHLLDLSNPTLRLKHGHSYLRCQYPLTTANKTSNNGFKSQSHPEVQFLSQIIMRIWRRKMNFQKFQRLVCDLCERLHMISYK